MTIYHYHVKMTGSRRGSSSSSKRAFSQFSPSVVLSLSLVLVYLFSLASGSYGVSVTGGTGEIVEPLPQIQGEEEEDDRSASSPSQAVVDASSSSHNNNKATRVKRSQQLCGYRLLDTLRTVCDRNFVAFTRRSDPSFFIPTMNNNDAGEGQSGEDIFLSGASMSPWDLALLSLEYPSHPTGSGGTTGDLLLSSSSNPNRESNSILDYFELFPQQQPVAATPPEVLPSASFPWSSTRSGGSPSRSASSTKAIALKMLAEPPKTHQRFRRNIIDECCKKPCTMSQMHKYCAITAVGKRSY